MLWWKNAIGTATCLVQKIGCCAVGFGYPNINIWHDFALSPFNVL